MTFQLDTNTDQRGTHHLISRIEVERAWADRVGAADMYERRQSPRNRELMLEAADYAERLQDAYNEQQAEVEGKRVMMVSTPSYTKFNPAWCKHGSVTDIMLPNDPGGSVWVCKDCGAHLTEDGQVDYIPTDEIEF